MKILPLLVGILFILIAILVSFWGIFSGFNGFKFDYKLVEGLPVFSSDSQASLILIVLIAMIILTFIPILKLIKM